MQNARYIESSYRASLNKHYCPKCNEMLKAVTVGNIVNGSHSADSSYMYGKMKTYRTEFQCPLCRLKYTMEDLRKIEQNYKNK